MDNCELDTTCTILIRSTTIKVLLDNKFDLYRIILVLIDGLELGITLPNYPSKKQELLKYVNSIPSNLIDEYLRLNSIIYSLLVLVLNKYKQYPILTLKDFSITSSYDIILKMEEERIHWKIR